ncbi:type II toxin-antitoxin system RelE/ParE family toxin [Sphingomonas sp. GB1N7]|uniref:type II toxin-antitoxin system RelE/ParE family toxin n=1 Tax=Parasphingomonas caseinilytica TaxID=3096158 RepID=UPI002FC79BAE
MRIRYLRNAEADLLAIHSTIADHNPRAADRLIDRIRSSVLRLRDYPESSPLRETLGRGIRSIPISSYVVYFRADADCVRIIRVLHSARDAEAIFRT